MRKVLGYLWRSGTTRIRQRSCLRHMKESIRPRQPQSRLQSHEVAARGVDCDYLGSDTHMTARLGSVSSSCRHVTSPSSSLILLPRFCVADRFFSTCSLFTKMQHCSVPNPTSAIADQSVVVCFVSGLDTYLPQLMWSHIPYRFGVKSPLDLPEHAQVVENFVQTLRHRCTVRDRDRGAPTYAPGEGRASGESWVQSG